MLFVFRIPPSFVKTVEKSNQLLSTTSTVGLEFFAKYLNMFQFRCREMFRVPEGVVTSLSELFHLLDQFAFHFSDLLHKQYICNCAFLNCFEWILSVLVHLLYRFEHVHCVQRRVIISFTVLVTREAPCIIVFE